MWEIAILESSQIGQKALIERKKYKWKWNFSCKCQNSAKVHQHEEFFTAIGQNSFWTQVGDIPKQLEIHLFLNHP